MWSMLEGSKVRKIAQVSATLAMLISLFGCGEWESESSRRQTISAPGDLNSPDSIKSVVQGDVVLDVKSINGSDGIVLLSIGDKVAINGTDNMIKVPENGCLVKRENEYFFRVVSCAEAPATGCLMGSVNENRVVYSTPCL